MARSRFILACALATPTWALACGNDFTSTSDKDSGVEGDGDGDTWDGTGGNTGPSTGGFVGDGDGDQGSTGGDTGNDPGENPFGLTAECLAAEGWGYNARYQEGSYPQADTIWYHDFKFWVSAHPENVPEEGLRSVNNRCKPGDPTSPHPTECADGGQLYEVYEGCPEISVVEECSGARAWYPAPNGTNELNKFRPMWYQGKFWLSKYPEQLPTDSFYAFYPECPPGTPDIPGVTPSACYTNGNLWVEAEHCNVNL